MTPARPGRASARTEPLHDRVASALAAISQRYTSSRRQLVDALARAGRPVTIGEIAGAGLPQSSVYRNLAVLEQAGVARRVVGADEFGRFELDERLTDHHHHHVVCRDCGAIEDLPADPALERAIAKVLGAAESSGFTVDEHRLDLLGRCRQCRVG